MIGRCLPPEVSVTSEEIQQKVEDTTRSLLCQFNRIMIQTESTECGNQILDIIFKMIQRKFFLVWMIFLNMNVNYWMVAKTH